MATESFLGAPPQYITDFYMNRVKVTLRFKDNTLDGQSYSTYCTKNSSGNASFSISTANITASGSITGLNGTSGTLTLNGLTAYTDTVSSQTYTWLNLDSDIAEDYNTTDPYGFAGGGPTIDGDYIGSFIFTIDK